MSLRTTSLAVAAALALGTPAAMASTPTADQTVLVQKTQAPVAASTQDASNYAQRDQQDAKKVGNYQGGSVVVVGISGGALIVILVLLLILL
ncbi:MAG: hypothetical protein QM831_29410 [Kofleriaceae bacterium]